MHPQNLSANSSNWAPIRKLKTSQPKKNKKNTKQEIWYKGRGISKPNKIMCIDKSTAPSGRDMNQKIKGVTIPRLINQLSINAIAAKLCLSFHEEYHTSMPLK